MHTCPSPSSTVHILRIFQDGRSSRRVVQTLAFWKHPRRSPLGGHHPASPVPAEPSFVSYAFSSFWNPCCHLCLEIVSILIMQRSSLPRILPLAVLMQASRCLFSKQLCSVHSTPGTVLSAADTETSQRELVIVSRSFGPSGFTRKGSQLYE